MAPAATLLLPSQLCHETAASTTVGARGISIIIICNRYDIQQRYLVLILLQRTLSGGTTYYVCMALPRAANRLGQ
jgi:hypothetical protein